MVSVLGRLMQKEFGRKRYREYCAKLKEKECMDIFCDIYFVLIENKEEHLDRRLLNLLQTVRDQRRIYGGRSFSDLYASSSGNKTCGFKYTGFGIWI